MNYNAGISFTDWGTPPQGGTASHDAEIAQRTIDTLLDSHDQPLFLGCGFYRPHTPLYAKQEWFDLHPISHIELPPGAVENDTNDLPYFGSKQRRPQDVEAPGLWTHDWIEENGKWKEVLQAYLASSSAMDFQLGRFLDAIEDSSFADSLYIICFSDHGYHLGEKRHWGKAAWELTTRVPFIISGPGIPTGVICDKPVDLLSIYPTVMDYAGLKPPHKLDGCRFVHCSKMSKPIGITSSSQLSSIIMPSRPNGGDIFATLREAKSFTIRKTIGAKSTICYARTTKIATSRPN